MAELDGLLFQVLLGIEDSVKTKLSVLSDPLWDKGTRPNDILGLYLDLLSHN